jgi:hypothetical protein
MKVLVDGDYVIRQTKMRLNYQPGKSQNVIQTGMIIPDPDVVYRMGYYNSSFSSPYTEELDGIVLEYVGGEPYMSIYNNGVADSYAQADWNMDKMDGSGPSGLTLDITKSQIFVVDLEWLGVGRVRVGFNINGKTIIVHEFYHANLLEGTYMISPNHSLRYEIRSVGGIGELWHICGSVQSEGGVQLAGGLYTAHRGITSYATNSNTSIHPLVSLRIRSDRPDGTLYLKDISILTTSTADYRWCILFNPTVAGVDDSEWVPAGGNSCVEYNVARVNTNILSGGTEFASGYVRGTSQSGGDITVKVDSAVRPGISIAGVSDQLVLAVQNITAANETYYGALNWLEAL